MLCQQVRAAITEALARDGAAGGEFPAGVLENGPVRLSGHVAAEKRPLSLEAQDEPRDGQKTAAPWREHLRACRECAAFYEQERALFAALDAGMTRVANAEAAASFLPRVRAAVDLEHSGDAGHAAGTWFAWWRFTAVAAAVCILLLVFASVSWRHRNESPTIAKVAPSNTSPVTKTVTKVDARPAISGAAPASAGLPRNPASRRAGFVAGVGVKKFAPFESSPTFPVAEVLVPADEREALARFLARLPAEREAAAALTRPARVLPAPDVAAEALEIAQLKVEPLAPTEEE
jgi:hypothetical protein